jgi:hypothetical protein
LAGDFVVVFRSEGSKEGEKGEPGGKSFVGDAEQRREGQQLELLVSSYFFLLLQLFQIVLSFLSLH